MNDNLKTETINALSWSLLESAVLRGLQFATGIVMARLLIPRQFGLIGMLLIFIAVARTFVEGGFGAALIQRSEPTQADKSSIFYFNVLIGIILTSLLCLAAPWIAAFFAQPILIPLTRVLSLTILINSLGTIQETLFCKEMNFRAHTITSLIAALLSGAVGISFALEGFGVWSLAFQQVSLSLFRTTVLWVISKWRPALVFSLESLRRMFGFGSRLLLSGLLDQVFQNIYFPVIGRLFSAGDLGLFTRARTLQSLPSQTLSEVVGRVTFPVFSKSQNDRTRLKRGLKKALTALALVNFPIMIGLAVTAKPLVIVLIGTKWIGCIPYLQLLCAVGLLYPLQAMNLNILMSLGRSDLFLRLEILKKILTVANLAISWHWGILGIIYGMIAVSVLSFYLNSYYTHALIGYPALEQLQDLLPYIAIASCMGIAVFSLGLFRFPSYLLMLLTQVATGVLLYVGACWIFRLSAFGEVWREFLDRLPFSGARTIV